MASRKKGPALFEVIRAAQQKQIEQQRKEQEAKTRGPGVLQNASALLGSPSYWLSKGKTAIINTRKNLAASKPITIENKPAKPVMREIPQPVGRTVEQDEIVDVQATPAEYAAKVEQPVIRQVIVEEPVVAEPVIPVAVHHTPAPAYESAAAAAARAVREEIAATASTSDPVYQEDQSDAVFVEPKAEETIDSLSDIYPAQKERASIGNWFGLKLNYTTGLVAGCLLLGAVAVALIATSDGSSQPKLVDGKVHPDAITNLQKTPAPQNNPPSTPPMKIAETPKTPDNTQLGSANKNDNLKLEQTKPIKVPTNVSRDVGKQYVVLISFPEKMKSEADSVVKFLADNGVAVTAEKGLPGYSKTWYSVVTARGFDKDKVNSTDYSKFKDTLTKLMNKYAQGSKFKSFTPDLYTWRAATPAN